MHRSTQRVSELIPGKRVAWHVLDGYLAFVADKAEWTGTDIVFDIARQGDAGTEVRFTHVGLAPDNECFGSCSTAWRSYVGTSLRNLITAGQGAPSSQSVLPAPQPRGDPGGGRVAGDAGPPGVQEAGRRPGRHRGAEDGDQHGGAEHRAELPRHLQDGVHHEQVERRHESWPGRR